MVFIASIRKNFLNHFSMECFKCFLQREIKEKKNERESLYVERYIYLCILEGAQRKIINKKAKVKCFLQGNLYRNVLLN